MAVTLTSRDLDDIDRAAELLLSPLDFHDVDAWRSAVNRQLKEMLGADSAGFLLPVTDGLLLYSEEHDPAELARYPDYPPPPLVDGTTLWKAMVEHRVRTLAELYGDDYDRYLNSAYYQEYAGANGAHDTLAVAASLGGADARSAAILHFWHARPDGRLFGPRETTMLRLLYHSFRAGVEALLRWGSYRKDLLQTLDAVGQAAVVCDLAGRVREVTPALEALLEVDPEAAVVREALRATVAAVRAATGIAPGGGVAGVGPAAGLVARDVTTTTARYRLAGCLHGMRATSGAPSIVVSLTRLTPMARCAVELGAEFGLTRAEAGLAILLAGGRTNTEIANELFISPHTARRHTEKVLLKLNVRSRAQVAGKVLSAA